MTPELLTGDPFAFTLPRWDPEEVAAWFPEGGPEPCPPVLAPLHVLLPILKRRIGPIGKTGKMEAQVDKETGKKKGPEYAFRKIEDILDEAHRHLCDLGISWRKVAIVRHELKDGGRAQQCVMEVVYELTGPLGDTVRTTAVGQATDFGSDKATNKADTAARKNMLVDLLQLATEDPDSERPDRVDERPEVQHPPARDAVAAVERVKALSEAGREEVKDWAGERGITVTPRALTVGQLRQLSAFVASIEKREKELAEAAAGTDPEAPAAPAENGVVDLMGKLEEAVDKAKEARDRHPQPASRASRYKGQDAETITAEAVETIKRKAGELTDDQRATVLAWANEQGIDVTLEGLPSMVVGDFTKVMRAITNELRIGKAVAAGTAGKKAASRPPAAKKAVPKPPAEDDPAAIERKRLRADLVGRAEVLTAESQAEALEALAKADGPTGVTLSEAIESCPPMWDEWLATMVERLENAEDERAATKAEDEAAPEEEAF